MARTHASYLVSDPVRQARDDLAEEMANGCPSVSEAARRLRMTQTRADQHWQAIRAGLDAASHVPGGRRWSV
jgi:hypothetical protein